MVIKYLSGESIPQSKPKSKQPLLYHKKIQPPAIRTTTQSRK
uniref:Uncharacterized protein n=1 Tax=Aquilaria malaccensis TaxID=223753 RepID=A0A4Y6GNK9_9ROSI|nr:hypothetical protein [Aquilaria malaccensis]